MSHATHDSFRIGRTASNLEEIDREIARLARLCRVRLLQPGVIDRMLAGDASACGSDNAIAFGKLRQLLMLHFVVRARSAEQLGQRETVAIESYVVGRLAKSFPELAADWPPA